MKKPIQGLISAALVGLSVIAACNDDGKRRRESAAAGTSGGQNRTDPAICGDCHVGPGEGCDDCNTVSADGCSATCQLEATCEDLRRCCFERDLPQGWVQHDARQHVRRRHAVRHHDERRWRVRPHAGPARQPRVPPLGRARQSCGRFGCGWRAERWRARGRGRTRRRAHDHRCRRRGRSSGRRHRAPPARRIATAAAVNLKRSTATAANAGTSARRTRSAKPENALEARRPACGSRCTNLASDLDCGSCDAACGDGEACMGGACACIGSTVAGEGGATNSGLACAQATRERCPIVLQTFTAIEPCASNRAP